MRLKRDERKGTDVTACTVVRLFFWTTWEDEGGTDCETTPGTGSSLPGTLLPMAVGHHKEEEEDAAAGTVDALSNKANHSAVILFCNDSISMICFHLGTSRLASFIKYFLCKGAERENLSQTRDEGLFFWQLFSF